MTTKAPVSVRVTRRYAASAERVFDAWLDPAMIGRWMFGPAIRDEEVLRLRVDARVGGGFSFLVRRDGQEIDHVGTYREIDRPRRLVFTFSVEKYSTDADRVEIDIVPLDAGCELTLTHEMKPEWADYAARTEEGWAGIVEGLARVLGE